MSTTKQLVVVAENRDFHKGAWKWVLLSPRNHSGNSYQCSTIVVCCLVTQSCLTLCDPMKCSMPGFPVLHQLPELAQIHVHWVSDAIQPSHHLLSSSYLQFFPASGSFPVLFIRWLKYCSFSFSTHHSSEYSGLISFRIDWLALLEVQGTSKSLLQHLNLIQASILQCSAFFMVQLSHPYTITPIHEKP